MLFIQDTSCHAVMVKEGVKSLKAESGSFRKEEINNGDECCVQDSEYDICPALL